MQTVIAMTIDRHFKDYQQIYAERTKELNALQRSLQTKKQMASAKTDAPDSVDVILKQTLDFYQTTAQAWLDNIAEGKAFEYQKIERELKEHYQLRDIAFIQAMVAKKPEDQHVPDTCPLDDQLGLTCPLQMISQFKDFEATKNSALNTLEQQIKMLLATQKNWQTYVIEYFSPSFILNYFKYETFQTKVCRQVLATTKAYAEIKDEIKAAQLELAAEYHRTYNRLLPDDLDTYHRTLVNNEQHLSAYIDNQPNTALKAAYQLFLSDKTVKNQKNFYQLFFKLTDDETTHTTTTHMILALYPSFTPYYQPIQIKVRAEDTIRALIERSYQRQEERSTYWYFLRELDTHYQAWLTEPSPRHLDKLHYHITTPLTHKKNRLLMQIMRYLETYYAQPLNNIKGTPIVHMNTDACITLIKQFNIDKPTKSTSIALKFLSLPTWERLTELEEELKKNEYHTDPTTAALIGQLMDVCLFSSTDETLPPENIIPSKQFMDDCNVSSTDRTLQLENPILPEQPLSDYPDFDENYGESDDLEQQKLDNYKETLQYSVALLQTPLNERATLTMLRDRAFFQHIQACELKHYELFTKEKLPLTDYARLAIKPAIVNDAMPIVPSTLSVLQTYRSTRTSLKAELDAIDKQIMVLEETKPAQVTDSLEMLDLYAFSWVFSYFLQIISPLIAGSIPLPERKMLIARRNELRDEIYKAEVAFNKQWNDTYPIAAPKMIQDDAEHLASLFNIMRETLTQLHDSEVTEHFQRWLACSTETTLLALYQQLCILHYKQPDNATFTDSMATLHCLYPDMSAALTDTEQQISTQLYQNDQMYRIAMTFPAPELEDALRPLQKKLRWFLSEKSAYSFVVLYQHLISNPVYQGLPQAKQLRVALETLYPEMINRIKIEQEKGINQIPAKRHAELLLAYYNSKINHPVFTAVIVCLKRPCWQHLTALRAAMEAHPDYNQDPLLAKLACSFMEACLDAPEDLTFAKGERLSSQAQHRKYVGFFTYCPEQTATHPLQQYLQPFLADIAAPTQPMKL